MSHYPLSEDERRQRMGRRRKPKPVEAGPVVTREQWRDARHPHCMVCGEYLRAGYRQVHEIAYGPARAKALLEPAAWILTCAKCHEERLHGAPSRGGLTILTQLAIKKLEDGTYYDPSKVNVLRGRHPDHITDAEVQVEVQRLVDGGEPWMRPYRWVG